jgi:hypothetical protein
VSAALTVVIVVLALCLAGAVALLSRANRTAPFGPPIGREQARRYSEREAERS